MISRRSFIKIAGCAGAGTALSRAAGLIRAQPQGANNDIRVAVIGLNGKGASHVKLVMKEPGVRLVALCDVDPQILAREVRLLENKNIKVFHTTDARLLYERKDVDAVVIATPDHWHALLTVWACQAGKDVYVEKPVSHAVEEGRIMINAAKKYKRIAQAGSQLRSDTGLSNAIHAIRGGELGKIESIRGICYKLRKNIGKKPAWKPGWLDYDLWCGPSEPAPLERDNLHYDWQWSWATGNGDMANMGAHIMDIARRFIGDSTAPRGLIAAGGRFGHIDAAQTPNTVLAVFDYPNIPVIFESRGLPSNPGGDVMDHYRGIRTGVVVQCEHGYYAGYVGGGLFDNRGKLIRRIKGDGGARHFGNFFNAMRTRRAENLAAPLETAHASVATCHYANISHRTGAPVSAQNLRENISCIPDSLPVLDGMLAHLKSHGVNIGGQPFQSGNWLAPDFANDTIVDIKNAGADTIGLARSLLKKSQRPPFLFRES